MEQSEIQRLVDLRAFLMKRYKDLDGRNNPGTSVILQRDVADTIERSIKSLDAVLSRHVKIKKM